MKSRDRIRETNKVEDPYLMARMFIIAIILFCIMAVVLYVLINAPGWTIASILVLCIVKLILDSIKD